MGSIPVRRFSLDGRNDRQFFFGVSTRVPHNRAVFSLVMGHGSVRNASIQPDLRDRMNDDSKALHRELGLCSAFEELEKFEQLIAINSEIVARRFDELPFVTGALWIPQRAFGTRYGIRHNCLCGLLRLHRAQIA
jgi:hypothetical protein